MFSFLALDQAQEVTWWVALVKWNCSFTYKNRNQAAEKTLFPAGGCIPRGFAGHSCTTGTSKYSKHPHIRTLILEVRLIRFLYIGCLVKNQPEGVLKLFLKIGGGNQNCNKYTKKSLRLN